MMMKLSRATRKTKRCEERANTQTKRVLALLLHKSIGIKNNMNEKELSLIMLELDIQGLKDNIYRYRLACGLKVVYYMFDFEKMMKGIITPIYLENEDVAELKNYTEDELFEKFYWNTVMISRPEILTFADYMKELIPKCEDAKTQYLLKQLSERISLENSNEKLWCVTNSFREKGSYAGLFIPLLKKFCKVQKKEKLLLGFGNNDFVFLYAENEETKPMIENLTYKIHHILEGADKLTECKILQYDYRKDILTEFKK